MHEQTDYLGDLRNGLNHLGDKYPIDVNSRVRLYKL